MRNTIHTIVEGVANALGYEASEIYSNRRFQPLVLARQICYYIAYKDETYTCTYIGKNIGNRDHSTVLHGIGKVEGYMKTNDSLFLQYMDALNKKAPHIYTRLKPIRVLRSKENCNPTHFEIKKYN